MQQAKNEHSIGSIFVIALFCVFAVTVLLCAILGSGIYKSIASAADERYNERTALSYIETKLRHYDDSDSIYLTELDGISAAAMDETIENHVYNTIIYCSDGFIRELFFEKGTYFKPSDGTPIIAAQNLSFSFENDNLIKITMQTEHGDISSIYYSIKSA